MIRRNDAALSDIVGTSILLAVTVVAAGAVAVGFSSMGTSPADPPRVDILANATESGAGFITIRHAGGAPIPRDGIEVVVSASSWTQPVRVALNASDLTSTFEIGSAAFLDGVGQPLLAGDHVELLFYLRDTGTLVGAASFTVASATASAALILDDFLVDVLEPSSGAAVPAGGTLFVSAKATHPGGRIAVERVIVDMWAIGGSAAYPLHDDGTEGDALAGDGIFSAYLAIPPQATEGPHALGVYAFDLDANRNNLSGSDTTITVTILPSSLSTIQSLLSAFNNTTALGTNGLNGLSGSSGGTGATGGNGTVTLAGPQGPPGANGTIGANGTTGGNGTAGGTGATGGNGTAGANGTAGGTGATGGNGTAGANGTAGGNGSAGANGQNGSGLDLGPAPTITDMTPTSGGFGTIVRLTGERLVNITSVTLAVQGASTGYASVFAIDASAVPGTSVLFSVPNIPEAAYVVTVTRLDGAWASAPTTFTVVALHPEITSVTPPNARSYTQIVVEGTNFNGVSAVLLRSAALGDVAVPWALVSDSELVFVTHPGLAPGFYDVVVSNGINEDVAPFAFEALSPLSPSGLTIAPSSAGVGTLVTISGVNLDTVSRLVLSQTNDTHVVEPPWYLDGDDIIFTIPASAASEGNWSVSYRVQLTGSFLSVAEVPESLTVTPAGWPTITSFTPVTGEPFTQVDIYGTNFVNVESVKFGEIVVYFAEVTPEHILAVTHAGLGTGSYLINVTTPIGSAYSTASFQALPLKLIPIYNKTILSGFGVNITTAHVGNNDPVVKLEVKIRSQPGWTVTGLTFNPVNFLIQQSSATEKAMTLTTPACTAASGITRWTMSNVEMHSYHALANEFDWVFGVTATGPTGTVTHYVFTNDETRNFILPAGVLTTFVADAGFATSFTNCNA